MSEAAREYYEHRGILMGTSQVPPILDGVPEQILHAHTLPMPKRLVSNFAEYAEDVEPYVIDGVRHAGREGLSDEKWERVCDLPRYKAANTAAEFAAIRIAPSLLAGHASGNIVFLEALAPSEIPRSAFLKATENLPLVRLPEQEIARVALLGRTINPYGELIAAFLTIMWGEHKIVDAIRSGLRSKSEYLTPRYLGASVSRRGLRHLPPFAL